MKYLFLIPLLLSLLPARAELIPAARLVPWTPGTHTGIPGGIPNWTRITNAVTQLGCDNTGATNISSAVQAWFDLCHSQSNVLYFPPGTYLSSGISVQNAKSYTVFRGAGTNTIMVMTNAAPFISVTGVEGVASNITESVLLKGATNFGLADTSEIMVGGIGRLTISNDFEFVAHTYGYNNGMRRQIVRIEAKTATNLTVWPPLYDNYTNVTFTQLANETHNIPASRMIGVEDMLIELELSSTWPLYFSITDACWVKNVRTHKAPNYHIYFEQSLSGEIRDCWADELLNEGSNGAGFLFNTCSGLLVENNIVFRARPLIEVNHGSSGNVFGYNHLVDSTYSGVIGEGISANHGPFNQFNLYEGNVAPNIKWDGYFGGAGNDTAFRNWFHASVPDTNVTERAMTIDARRFSRNLSIVGNVLGQTNRTWIYSNTNASTSYVENYIYQFGNPYIDNGGNNGLFAPPWVGENSTNRDSGAITLTTTTGSQFATSSAPFFVSGDASPIFAVILSDGASGAAQVEALVSSTVVDLLNPFAVGMTNESFNVWPGPNGFGAVDTNVFNTAIVFLNWNYASNAISEPHGDPLPDSLYRTAKPSWYGSLVWPTHTPAAATMLSPIPAENRYNGVGGSVGYANTANVNNFNKQ